MLLMRDFNVKRELSEKASLWQPHLPSTETLPVAPLLDIEKARKGLGCNCSIFPVVNDMFVNFESEEESQVDSKIHYFIWFHNKLSWVDFINIWSRIINLFLWISCTVNDVHFKN